MNEEKIINAFEKLSENALEDIDKILDNPEANGLDVLAVLLAMPD